MKNTILLDALLSDPTLKMEDLHLGLTNTNYLLTFDQETYVLRVPYADSGHIVNRHHETLALDAIADCGIDVETIYYDEASGYKVTNYIADAQTYGECNAIDKIERVATLMKKFHSLHKKTGVFFDPVQRYETYLSHIKKPLYDVTCYANIIDNVNRMKHEQILCHNDWVDGNVLFSKEHTYLIDYEYAADNDPLFDVISFLSENQIYDKELRTRFYDHYFDSYDKQTLYDLLVWEVFADLLWCTWAMMMWESRNEKVYAEIAAEKYQRLQLLYKELYS